MADAVAADVDGQGGDAMTALCETLTSRHLALGRRGLVLCGAAPGAGVSFVTAELGRALSDAGLRTLVIEANLRTPAMAHHFPTGEAAKEGLQAFLSGDALTPPDIIREVSPELSVVFAGAGGDDPSNLFETPRFEELVQYALRTFDCTLVDTPAANAWAEVRRIAEVVGYAALVARRDVTMAEDLRALAGELAMDGVSVVGSIFNEG
ncbi:MAG: CpsD/CapB family tyrosine-protein kinase [Phenylobacterium sp.]|nr:CpsD/CapB family tyrosine-protein kinase [Phenylobacterium sp.]